MESFSDMHAYIHVYANKYLAVIGSYIFVHVLMQLPVMNDVGQISLYFLKSLTPISKISQFITKINVVSQEVDLKLWAAKVSLQLGV